MSPSAVPGQRLAQKAFVMAHASDISAARRYGQQLAEQAGFSEVDAGRLAIVVTEAATNILKHATHGWVMLCEDNSNAIEVLAIDSGPGIGNLGRSLRDGFSTAGTCGTGLGAMRRLSSAFDVYSQPQQGTAVYMQIGADAAHAEPAADDGSAPFARKTLSSRLRLGAVCVPIAGEDACGDAWSVIEDHVGVRIVVADGLGHGTGAHTAAQAAVAVLHARAADRADVVELINDMHQALRPTRGAAVAVAVLDFQQDEIAFAGIGNITACVFDASGRRQLVSHNGIVGHNLRKVQQFNAACGAGTLNIFCSDGIGTQWDLAAYPDLQDAHPALIAAILFRDFRRVRDDATVLVVQRLN